VRALADLGTVLEEPHMSQTEFVHQSHVRTTPEPFGWSEERLAELQQERISR
jgi:hypothetical protein